LALSSLETTVETVAEGAIDLCEYACAALLLITEDQPQLALPGIVSGINDGDLDLDDHDITEDAKEQIQGLADSIATM